MPGVMGRHPIALNRGDEGVVGNAGIFDNHLVQHLRDGRRSRRWNGELAVLEAPDSFVAGAPGRQEDNGWGQTLVSKDLEQFDWVYGRWHECEKV